MDHNACRITSLRRTRQEARSPVSLNKNTEGIAYYLREYIG